MFTFTFTDAVNDFSATRGKSQQTPLPHSGRKSRFLAPLDIPDISGYQLGIESQIVKTRNTENHAINQKIFQIRFVSSLDICKIVILCPGQHHVKAQVWSSKKVSKTQIKAK